MIALENYPREYILFYIFKLILFKDKVIVFSPSLNKMVGIEYVNWFT